MKKFTLLVLSLVGACAVEDDLEGETTQAVVSDNGVSLNGVSLNGVSLNGVSLNGVSLNGTSLSGVQTNGTAKTGPIVGSIMRASLSNGATMQLRFDSASALGTQTVYGVSYYADGGWKPLCEAGATAFAIPGTWDTRAGVPGGGAYTSSSTTMTLACRGKSIAKCVEMGYKPNVYNKQLMACVRLLRGDYCGDGSTWTVTGNQVNIYDGVGVQTDTMAWDIEAEWTPQGARCLTARRETRFFTSLGVQPTCVKNGLIPISPLCGTQGFGKAELVSEIPPETVAAAKAAYAAAK